MSKQQIKEDLRKQLLEKKGDTHDYGCAMLFFNIGKKSWDEFQSMIDDEDIYTEEGDQSFGRENEPHVTILYGLHDTIDDKTIEELVDTIKAPELKLKKISIFENNDDYDVVKFDIIGDSATKLGKMNAKFAKLPHTTSYPDYHPHSTIAYVKAGTGKKYVKTLSDDEAIKVTPTEFVYSKADGTKNKYKLK
jgi:2'-5' RNA ligase